VNEKENQRALDAEIASLRIVKQAQEQLAHALNSMGGIDVAGTSKFIAYSGRHMNQAVDGYILLRDFSRYDSSKLLIRPMIEIMFRVQAVHRQPSLIYRILYGERVERAKWGNAAANRLGVPYVEKEGWEAFRKYCADNFPKSELKNSPISLHALAEKAGFEGYYDSHYRLYCKFTHSGLEAILGDLIPLSDPEDNRTAALCVFAAIEALLAIGASSPKFESLKQKLAMQTKSGSPPR
jgi:Family of unknown function (DUF5677)